MAGWEASLRHQTGETAQEGRGASEARLTLGATLFTVTVVEVTVKALPAVTFKRIGYTPSWPTRS